MKMLWIVPSTGSPCGGHSVRSDAVRRYLLSPSGCTTEGRYALTGTLQTVTLSVVIWISIGACCQCWADVCPVGNGSMLDVDAAAMVKAVRESEQWIHRVDSLQLRIESVWSSSSAGVGAGSRACPGDSGQPQGAAEGLLEYAFDKSRLRFLEDQPGESRSVKIWDGKEFIGCELTSGRREQYLLDATPEGNFDDILASETAWPRSQPHAFWWDQKDVDALAVFFGRPEEFKCIGREKYRDTDCHILELRPTEVRAILHGESYGCDCGIEDQQEHGRIGEVRGLVDQSCRWYVGVEDGRLRGITWFIAERPRLEHWMSDYREVGPGCWLPMAQGYQVYNKDKDDRAYVERRRDLKVVEARVNMPLADDLFRLQIREGARVQDKRSGRLVTYDYKPAPPGLVGRPLPALDQASAQLDPASVQGRAVLLCFWDIHQRPSRHCIRQLADRSACTDSTGVAIVTIQMADVEPASLARWVQENSVSFPVLTPRTEHLDSIRLAWSIRSLPWLVLADRTGIVCSLGFPPSELDTQLAALAEPTDRRLAASRSP